MLHILPRGIVSAINRMPAAVKGFTFLEIVCALAILAIGIVAVLTLFPVGLENSKRAGERTRAAVLAYQQLQRYRAMGYAYVNHTLAYKAGNQNFSSTDPADTYFKNYVTVGSAPDVTSGAVVTQVTVKAWWPSNEGYAKRQKSLTMSTLISER